MHHNFIIKISKVFENLARLKISNNTIKGLYLLIYKKLLILNYIYNGIKSK
jgi:hypothetical protein